jgi:hypothetical protein
MSSTTRTGGSSARHSISADPCDENISAMFWPYRPRQGYPSAPAWLLVLALLGTAALCGAASLRDPLRSFSGVGERVECV